MIVAVLVILAGLYLAFAAAGRRAPAVDPRPGAGTTFAVIVPTPERADVRGWSVSCRPSR
jgi:hypothetical protein